MNKKKARIRRGLKTKALIAKSDRPRLVVFKSAKHIYAQIVAKSEQGDIVIVSASTIEKNIRAELAGDKKAHATLIGKKLAQKAKEKNVAAVAFDRSGYAYHGRIKALADGAREDGLLF